MVSSEESGLVPGLALRESVIKGNLGDINSCASCGALGNSNNSLEDVLEVAGDIVTAALVRRQAESTTFRGASRAATPADWANTVGTVVTWRVAQACIVLLLR